MLELAPSSKKRPLQISAPPNAKNISQVPPPPHFHPPQESRNECSMMYLDTVLLIMVILYIVCLVVFNL